MTSVSMTQLLAAASLPLESDSETDYEYDPAVGCSLTAFGIRLRLTMSMTQLLAAASLPLEPNSETDYEYDSMSMIQLLAAVFQPLESD